MPWNDIEKTKMKKILNQKRLAEISKELLRIH